MVVVAGQALRQAQVGWAVEKVLAALAVSVEQLVDDAASVPAFAFAFRDFGEWPLEQGHTLGIARLCTDDSDSIHIEN